MPASTKRAIAICDICGFQYPHRVLKWNSYGLLVCPTDYEGSNDLKNHPQNKTPDVRDDEYIKNPRPNFPTGDNQSWNASSSEWEDEDAYWNTI